MINKGRSNKLRKCQTSLCDRKKVKLKLLSTKFCCINFGKVEKMAYIYGENRECKEIIGRNECTLVFLTLKVCVKSLIYDQENISKAEIFSCKSYVGATLQF